MEPGVFKDLVLDDQIPTVVRGIEQAVLKSFEEDRQPGRIILVTAMPRITAAEMKRRVQICVNIFRVCRGDMKWAVERIIDHLPRYLRAELDGQSWEPEAKRAFWTTG